MADDPVRIVTSGPSDPVRETSDGDPGDESTGVVGMINLLVTQLVEGDAK